MTQPEAPLPAVFLAIEDPDLASLRVILGNWQYVFDVGPVPVGISELCRHIDRQSKRGIGPTRPDGGLRE